MKLRLISGILAGVLLLSGICFLPPIGSWFIIAIISALAQFEFYVLVNRAGIPVFRYLGIFCGTAIISATFLTGAMSQEEIHKGYMMENIILLSSLVLVFFRQFPQKDNDKPLATIACTILGICYVPFLFNYFTRIVAAWGDMSLVHHELSPAKWLIIYLLVVVKLSDVGAYFIGSAIGRHKLMPRISPKKTWEGFIGGMATSLIASLIFFYATKGHFGWITMELHDAIILGLVLPLLGVVGDLFESLLKRSAEMKDSSTIIPGMGGILDMIDSVLFATPALYFYTVYFLS